MFEGLICLHSSICERILTLPMDLLQFVVAIIKVDFKESNVDLQTYA